MGEADGVAAASQSERTDPTAVSSAVNASAERPHANIPAEPAPTHVAGEPPQVDAAGEPPSAGATQAEASKSVQGSVADDATMAMSPEQLRGALAAALAERDGYLETAQRIQAEFDNFRKRSAGDLEERVKGGLGRMAEALLPVLDACDAAIAQGDSSAEAMRGQLLAVLIPRGLEPIDAAGELFDPNLHDAVLHEQGDGGEAVVAEELRPGYRWNGKVLRAAMVKVRN